MKINKVTVNEEKIDTKEAFYRYFIIGLILDICNMFIKFLRVYCCGKFSENVVYDIRNKYLLHTSRIRFDYLDNNSSLELL